MVAANAAWSSKSEDWSQAPGQRRYGAVRGDQPAIYALGCDDWHHSADVRPCMFGKPGASRTVLLLGDSIAGQWVPAVERHFLPRGWRLVVVTKSACPMVDAPVFNAATRREYGECGRWRDEVLGRLGEWHPDLVVVSSSPAYGFSPGEWREGTARILARIAPHTRRIALLEPTPILPFDAPACLARRDWRRAWIVMGDTCIARRNDGDFAGVVAALSAAVAGQPKARLIDLGDAACPRGICRAEWNGIVAYRDGRHFTARYAATLTDALGRLLDKSWGPESDNFRH
jgi:hypothetical protein